MKRHLGFILTLVLLAFPALAQMEKSDKAASHKAGVAEAWIAAWNSHDAEKLAALFTEDVMYEDIPFGEVNHGRQELRKFAASEFEAVPDLKVELKNSSIQGGHGSIEWLFTGTDKGIFKTGKQFSVRGASIITVKNGKISRNVDYYDVTTMMRQVGQLPPAENTPDK
jgi:steroid delta-isomerase-like uncharacterized protein